MADENNDVLGDGEHVQFKIKRLKDELGEDMQIPQHCPVCHEHGGRHNPVCLTLRKRK